MPKKLTLKYCIDYVKKKYNGTCISRGYKRSSIPLLWKCALSHTWPATWNSVRDGSWCKECVKVKKPSVSKCKKIINKIKEKCCIVSKLGHNKNEKIRKMKEIEKSIMLERITDFILMKDKHSIAKKNLSGKSRSKCTRNALISNLNIMLDEGFITKKICDVYMKNDTYMDDAMTNILRRKLHVIGYKSRIKTQHQLCSLYNPLTFIVKSFTQIKGIQQIIFKYANESDEKIPPEWFYINTDHGRKLARTVTPIKYNGSLYCYPNIGFEERLIYCKKCKYPAIYDDFYKSKHKLFKNYPCACDCFYYGYDVSKGVYTSPKDVSKREYREKISMDSHRKFLEVNEEHKHLMKTFGKVEQIVYKKKKGKKDKEKEKKEKEDKEKEKKEKEDKEKEKEKEKEDKEKRKEDKRKRNEDKIKRKEDRKKRKEDRKKRKKDKRKRKEDRKKRKEKKNKRKLHKKP